MKRTLLLLALAAALALTGCLNSDEKKAKEAINAKLTDPKSAIFTGFIGRKTVPEAKVTQTVARIHVNSKNSFGGYTGAKEWAVIFDKDGKVVNVGLREELAKEYLALYKKSRTRLESTESKVKALDDDIDPAPYSR